MIVVIDSGIWVSAWEFGGTPAAALERAISSGLVATCEEIENEVVRVLFRKFHRSPEKIRGRLQSSLAESIRVEVSGEVSGICRDPNDDCILECAVKAGAEFIITGDNDLLILGQYGGIRILTAREYLELQAEP